MPEVILIVPDFIIYVYGSSCQSLFSGLTLALLLSIFPFLGIPSYPMGVSTNAKNKQSSDKGLKKRELHELPYTYIVNLETIRLASVGRYTIWREDVR